MSYWLITKPADGEYYADGVGNGESHKFKSLEAALAHCLENSLDGAINYGTAVSEELRRKFGGTPTLLELEQWMK